MSEIVEPTKAPKHKIWERLGDILGWSNPAEPNGHQTTETSGWRGPNLYDDDGNILAIRTADGDVHAVPSPKKGTFN